MTNEYILEEVVQVKTALDKNLNNILHYMMKAEISKHNDIATSCMKSVKMEIGWAKEKLRRIEELSFDLNKNISNQNGKS